MNELDFPKIKPEDAVGLYLSSKKIEREQLLSEPLKFEKAREGVSVDLIKSKRILKINEEKLLKAREDYVNYRKSFDKQVKELNDKEKELKENFKSFNTFVKENENKRIRVKKKIQSAEATTKITEKTLETIRENKKKLLRLKTILQSNIKKYLIYEDYLIKVAEKYENAEEISDLIDQFNNLTFAKQILSKKHESDLKLLQEIKDRINELISKKSAILIGRKNEFEALEARYLRAKKETLKWEGVVDEIQEKSIEFAKEKSTVKDGIRKIYADMCKSDNVSDERKVNDDDYKGQLGFIKNYLRRLDECVVNIKKEKEIEYLSN